MVAPASRAALPSEWNIGAGTACTSPVRNGTRWKIAVAATRPAPRLSLLREAPLGVPVVPEVRMTWRPWRSGLAGSSEEAAATRVGRSGVPSAGARSHTRRATSGA